MEDEVYYHDTPARKAERIRGVVRRAFMRCGTAAMVKAGAKLGPGDDNEAVVLMDDLTYRVRITVVEVDADAMLKERGDG